MNYDILWRPKVQEIFTKKIYCHDKLIYLDAISKHMLHAVPVLIVRRAHQILSQFLNLKKQVPTGYKMLFTTILINHFLFSKHGILLLSQLVIVIFFSVCLRYSLLGVNILFWQQLFEIHLAVAVLLHMDTQLC